MTGPVPYIPANTGLNIDRLFLLQPFSDKFLFSLKICSQLCKKCDILCKSKAIFPTPYNWDRNASTSSPPSGPNVWTSPRGCPEGW